LYETRVDELSPRNVQVHSVETIPGYVVDLGEIAPNVEKCVVLSRALKLRDDELACYSMRPTEDIELRIQEVEAFQADAIHFQTRFSHIARWDTDFFWVAGKNHLLYLVARNPSAYVLTTARVKDLGHLALTSTLGANTPNSKRPHTSLEIASSFGVE
jgi:hypothetical protein